MDGHVFELQCFGLLVLALKLSVPQLENATPHKVSLSSCGGGHRENRTYIDDICNTPYCNAVVAGLLER